MTYRRRQAGPLPSPAILLLAAAVLLLGLFLPGATAPAAGQPAPGAPAVVEREAVDAKPVLLLIHGGGFSLGSPRYMNYAARIVAEDSAFETFQPAYPLDNLRGAFYMVRDVALGLRRAGRSVFAYGDSAGGAIAVWLASHGFVDAAAAKAPPTDLIDWHSPIARRYERAPAWASFSWRHLRATPRLRRQLSTADRRSRRPVRIFQSCRDAVIPCGMNIRFARRDPNVSLFRISGYHADGRRKAFAFTRALRWLKLQTG